MAWEPFVLSAVSPVASFALVGAARWLWSRWERKLDANNAELKAELTAIRQQTTLTNGRVSELELDVAWLMGKTGEPRDRSKRGLG
jgi:hypothetical protein